MYIYLTYLFTQRKCLRLNGNRALVTDQQYWPLTSRWGEAEGYWPQCIQATRLWTLCSRWGPWRVCRAGRPWCSLWTAPASLSCLTSSHHDQESLRTATRRQLTVTRVRCTATPSAVAPFLQIFRLKCTRFYFGWGSAPDPSAELTAFPRPPT